MPSHDLLLLIGRLDAKLDLLLVRHDKHEERLTRLEAGANRTSGVVATVAAVGGVVSSVAVHFLTQLLQR
jgi:hypothetical protein